MKKKELEAELAAWKFAAEHNCKRVVELREPIITPRPADESIYLYQLYKGKIER